MDSSSQGGAQRALIRPSFSLANLAQRMLANERNTLTFFDRSEARVVKTHPQIVADVARVVAHVRRSTNLAAGRAAVVVGPPSYAWLLAALACWFTGVEVVAVPESLQTEQVAPTLSGISFDLCFAADTFVACPALTTRPCFSLESLDSLEPPPPGGDPVWGDSPRPSIVAFTSGTTSSANLKAFRIDTETTEAFIEAFTDSFGITSDDTWAVVHPFSHVVHLEYVLGGLGWGYDVLLAEPLRVSLHCRDLQPSVLITVPGVYEQLARQVRRRLPREGERAARIERWLAQPLSPASREQAMRLAPRLMPEVSEVFGDRFKVMIIGAAPSSAELRRFLVQLGLPLFEGYGLSETNMLTCNLPGQFQLGSVGRVWPGVELRIDERGVVLARLQSARTAAYLNVAETENRSAFPGDGWFDTGDLGQLSDGYLQLSGRAKEIIVTNRGKKVNVASLEQRLQQVPGVGHGLVFGNDRPFLVAVLAPEAGQALPPRDALLVALEDLNGTLPAHERIVDFVSLPEPLSVDNGLLTRSGKARRVLVEERCFGQLEALYG